MYGGLFSLPMIFRLVIGRSWGQGAQHSQSIQSILSHFPGLTVLMPSSPTSIIKAYSYSVKKYKNPVIILEHRLLYDLDFDTKPINTFEDAFEPILVERGDDITIVATSVMVVEAKRCLKYIKKMNISAELIDLNCISHINEELIFESVKKTGRLLIIDTSWVKFGVSAEISRIISARNPNILKKPIISLGMKNSPCPTSKILEDKFYPDVHDILNSIIELCDLKKNEVNISIPKKHSTTDFFKKFKGPF
jgi:pyruvate dehydrogenase E1 component beta subunit